MKVAFAIPCYNTEKTIRSIVVECKKVSPWVVVVDDGSTDSTCREAELAGAVIYSHTTNVGYGGAIQTCLKAGRELGADVLITLDGDGQHLPSEAMLLVDRLIEGNLGIVIGYRTSMPLYRWVGKSVIDFSFNLGSKFKVRDSQSGFRAYSRVALGLLRPTEMGMGIGLEILEKARRLDLAIGEVPIHCIYFPGLAHSNLILHGLSVLFPFSFGRSRK